MRRFLFYRLNFWRYKCHVSKIAGMVQKRVVFVLGPPGVGKGTQCRKISNYYGFAHISAGELLRMERQTPNSQHGEVIDSCIKQGKVVPSEITCKLLEQEIESSKKINFLIDGFPRNRENREGWDNTVGKKIEMLFVLLIDCPVEICIERCLNRGAASGSNRQDDTIDILEKRITSHIEETQPTISYYAERNLVKLIDGNQTQEQVFEDIKNIFDEELQNFV